MAKPGVIAFPVLLVLGAITGYLAYTLLVEGSTPKEGVADNSPYHKPLPEKVVDNKPAGEVDKSKFSTVVTISILEGASVQGSRDYDPDPATAKEGALITFVNNDKLPHSATSGGGFDDNNYGKLFNSGVLDPGKEFSISASELGKGEHPYFCIVHPYMSGKITIE